MNRRDFIRDTSLLAAGAMLGRASVAAESAFPVVRVAESQRKFKSPAVERTIEAVKSRMGNQELAWMFENCFPNALDTTVDFTVAAGRPDTFVANGEIEAMGLRDSTAQVWPYLPLMKNDKALQQMIAGVINRQTRGILKDPYASAFYKDETRQSAAKSGLTEMPPGVQERKWEISSLCYPIRLAFGYWKASNDSAPLDLRWREAILKTLETFQEQQRKAGQGPYRFRGGTEGPGYTLADDGYGRPVKPVGLICSLFRPSGDATAFPFLVPSNWLAVVSLRQAAELLERVQSDAPSAARCRALADEVERALRQYAVVIHERFARVSPYEIDGYGNYYCIEDPNVPSLLALPYLDVVGPGDPLYLNTRRFILSDSNPYYCTGKAAAGPSSPHLGRDMIWPLGLIMQGLTSTDDQEVRRCLVMLQKTQAGSGFMHEAFNKDDPAKFAGAWCPRANSLFGELILKSFRERPDVLK